MKKRLEADLISIAHQILQLKNKSDINRLYLETQKLYEKLTVLRFVENYFEADKPTLNQDEINLKIETVFNQSEKEIRLYVADEENIKDIVAPPVELELAQERLEETSKSNSTPDMVEISFEELVEEKFDEDFFVKVEKETPTDFEEIGANEKETLSVVINKKIAIELTDRIAFTKHLFGNSLEDYNRVLNQLITFDTFDEAQKFIQDIVKPDYNNWKGKEEYENRFMEIMEKKFL